MLCMTNRNLKKLKLKTFLKKSLIFIKLIFKKQCLQFFFKADGHAKASN